MSNQGAELARNLARHAEAVCRHYLPNGRRHGRYWHVGDVRNAPGRSLYVRLTGPESGSGAAGKWTDAATGENGDLLDLIALNRGLYCFRDVLDEARLFLSLPRSEPLPPIPERPSPSGSREAARRLFRAGKLVPGTHAEAYLRARGITAQLDWPSLRFHPALWYRAGRDAERESWPGLLAAVTDAEGRITGVHRTWLDRHRPAKAPLADPRRALGQLLGHGVRFGSATDVIAAGEGIETMLALKSVLPDLPMIAALSANHLAALDLAPLLTRLYVARDRDPPGQMASARLHAPAARRASMFTTSSRQATISTPICAGSAQAPCSRGWSVSLHLTMSRASSITAMQLDGLRHLVGLVSAEAGRGAARGLASRSDGSAPAAFPSGDLPGTAPAGNGVRRLFSAAGRKAPGFASPSKIAASRHPPLALRPLAGRPAAGCRQARTRRAIAVKAAMGAVQTGNRSPP